MALGPVSAPLGSSSPRFVPGGPLSVPVSWFRWLCASSSCSATLTVVSTSQALAWLGAERVAGWRVVFEAGESVRMCDRCARLAP